MPNISETLKQSSNWKELFPENDSREKVLVCSNVSCPALYFMTTVPNVTIWQSRYSKLNFSQVIINYERDTARLMLSDFKDQSLFTQQIGSSLQSLPEPVLIRARSLVSVLSLVNFANSNLWLADWGPDNLPRVSEYSIDLLLDCGLGNGNLIQHKLFRSMRKFYHPSINLGQGCFAREL